MSRTAAPKFAPVISTLRLNDFTSAVSLARFNAWAAEVSNAQAGAVRVATGSAHTLQSRLTLEEIASGFTEGSVIFAAPGGSLAQDNANLFWKNDTNFLGIGVSPPTARLHVVETKTATSGTVNLGLFELSANPGGASTSIYRNAFAVKVTAANAQNLTAATGGLRGVDTYVSHGGTGTITSATNLLLDRELTSTGTITNSQAIHIIQPTIGTGTITNLYGIRIENMVGATTINDSISVAAGRVNFGSATSLLLPNSNGAAPTVSGHIAYDTTANALEYGDNGTNRTVANLDEAQTFSGNKTFSAQIAVSGTVIENSGVLTHGKYTPTLTNVANLGASTAYECQYLRVGGTVTVSGKVDVDPTAPAAATQLGISLPVASNLGAVEDCAGTAFASGIAGQGAAILGDAANNRAQMEWVSGDISNQPMYFQFSYQVI